MRRAESGNQAVEAGPADPELDRGVVDGNRSEMLRSRREECSYDFGPLLRRRPGSIVVNDWVLARTMAVVTLGVLASAPGAAAQVQSTAAAPYLYGLDRSDAEARAHASGLRTLFEGPSGGDARVTAQAPPAGTQVVPGTTIRLQMGATSRAVEVPVLNGLSRNEAEARAHTRGLQTVFEGPSSGDARVTAQAPPAGTQVVPGTTIRLQMEATSRAVEVPVLNGLSRNEAEARAHASGLQTVFEGPSSGNARVTAQAPPAGTQVVPGTTIRLQM